MLAFFACNKKHNAVDVKLGGWEFQVLFVLLLAQTGCNRQNVVICNPEFTDQCITVIDRAFSDIRYVIDGNHSKIPDSGYVKIRLSNHYRPGDTINICWEIDGYDWLATVNRSSLIESKLDEHRFKFTTMLDSDALGLPTEARFRQPGCTSVALYNIIHAYPEGTAVVRY
ncbi:MAG: hypothetical protein LAT67_14975 [Balneolales bacterium]|nr:hypothetical protein [Balneolales bacterium]